MIAVGVGDGKREMDRQTGAGLSKQIRTGSRSLEMGADSMESPSRQHLASDGHSMVDFLLGGSSMLEAWDLSLWGLSVECRVPS